MSRKKISEKEKQKLRNKAKDELLRIEGIEKDAEMFDKVNRFKHKFATCEIVYKVCLAEYLDKTSEKIHVKMKQVEKLSEWAKRDYDKNKSEICELIDKIIQNGKNANKNDMTINMTQVPAVLKFAGYDFDYNFLYQLFGSKRRNQNDSKPLKALRNDLTHQMSQDAINELNDKKRWDEVNELMDDFLNKIKSYDDGKE